MRYGLSEIDRQRFGHVTAKVYLENAGEVGEMLAHAKQDGVALLIIRVGCARLETVHLLEGQGAQLMDTLVHYGLRGGQAARPFGIEGYVVSQAAAVDADRVERAAAITFAGYNGHYHADPRLPRDQCDAVYSSWAAASCRGDGQSSGVILVEKVGDEGELAAFGTVALTGEALHEGILFGVSPEHQGRGLYAALMGLARNWGLERGSEEMRVSTQVSNLTVQRAWCRQGFVPIDSEYTFHLWMDG